jgi:hypothetical protein
MFINGGSKVEKTKVILRLFLINTKTTRISLIIKKVDFFSSCVLNYRLALPTVAVALTVLNVLMLIFYPRPATHFRETFLLLLGADTQF